MASGTMITVMFLLSMLHTVLAVTAYEEAEKQFLTKLGLSRKPIVNKNVDIPCATMELYKSMSEKNTAKTNFPLPGLHTKSANTARTYTNTGSPPINSKSQRYRLQFDIQPLPEREQVTAAEVRITMFYKARLEDDEFIHVLVHDIIEPGIKGFSKPILRLIDSKSINRSTALKSEVISFDVTPAIERLSEKNFDGNHGIIVQCVITSGGQTHIMDVFDFESSEKALLIVYTDDGTIEKNANNMMERYRTKRSADDEPTKTVTSKKSIPKICQRHPLWVDFQSIGFTDWIQAPQGYAAYYCYGACKYPLAEHMNATNHAVMQTFMNHLNPTSVTKSCCVPTKLGPQTLLYLDDEGKLVVKTYPDMTVEECGCR
ncbi:Transforming growth factor-beta, C-terminal,Cystine-knot cytokine,TGF-beta [Cinara cedri]|uniref:Transforming growth factor-beta, C-terminal,Cystine-knot cytokine,TGF-beta n=1 Tax=Cinara cedri TaxID=506608 RepID=A0A5E4MML9_9HEMI|nr:Transforming growth factor-beta, C-terminal,Cystine-knot cytokine,TGF-beta [Cinara cedri]